MDRQPRLDHRADPEPSGCEPEPAGRERQRGLAWALTLLLPVATALFGTVHLLPRLGLALAAGGLGAAALAWGGGRRGLHLGARLATALGLLAGLVAGLAFLPVGPGLRQLLQPAVAGPVLQALADSGHASDASRVLALDPGRGLVEWSVYLAMVLVVGGTAAVVHNRPRARRLALVFIGTGVACTIVGLLQRWTGADAVYWLTEVPLRSQRPFFGPFVDPNHAGMLMAAAVPPALALLRDRRTTIRSAAAAGALLLLLGTLVSGSRGAPVLLVIGAATGLALGGGRLVQAGVGVLSLAGLAVLVFVGPSRVAHWLTQALDPGQQQAVALGYGDVWSGRASLYAEVRHLVAGAPWLGMGPAGFDDAFRVVRSDPAFTLPDHAHQELLQALIEHGVLATGLALAALVVVGLAALRPDPSGGRGLARMQAGFAGSVAVIVAGSMYEFPLRAGALSLMAALSAGAVLGLAQAARAPVPRQGQTRAMALGGLVLVLGALGLHLGARALDRGPFADPDAAVLRGRSLLLAAGVDRDAGWVVGGDAQALDQAAAAFQQALWCRPVDRIALQELARVRFHQGDAEGAAQALRTATVVYPSLPWPWRDLARVRRAQGDDLAAWEAWSRALSYDLPVDFPVQDWLAEALQGPGGAAVAALAALPPRADRWQAAARLLEDRQDRQEAEILFQEAAQLDPAEGRAQYAFALLRWGRPAEVLAALPPEPTSCGEQRAKANALRLLSRCDEALPWSQQALASCGAEDRQARLDIARTRLCLGDERAIGVLEALIREQPDDPGPRRSLAAELARRGRSEEALRQLEVLDKAGQLKPEDVALRARLLAR